MNNYFDLPNVIEHIVRIIKTEPIGRFGGYERCVSKCDVVDEYKSSTPPTIPNEVIIDGESHSIVNVTMEKCITKDDIYNIRYLFIRYDVFVDSTPYSE